MNSTYLAPFFWYAILRAAFLRLRPSKSSTINSTFLALFFLYSIIRAAFREGIQGELHTPGQLTALEAIHVNNFFLPHTILFTKKQQDLFHDSQGYVECSEHSTSIEIPIYIFDETLYTWKIVEKAPTFYFRGNTFENDVTKVRRCKRPRKCNGPLYYLRHIRSCAVSNQCQCSVSSHMKSSIRKNSNDTIVIMKVSYGGGNSNDSIVIMQHSYGRGKRIGATFGILFTVSNQCQCSVSGHMKSSIRKNPHDTIVIMKVSYGGGNSNDSIVIMQHSYERGKRIGATFGILFTCLVCKHSLTKSSFSLK